MPNETNTEAVMRSKLQYVSEVLEDAIKRIDALSDWNKALQDRIKELEKINATR